MQKAEERNTKTLHVGKANATRGNGKRYTWERQTLHVGMANATRGNGKRLVQMLMTSPSLARTVCGKTLCASLRRAFSSLIEALK